LASFLKLSITSGAYCSNWSNAAPDMEKATLKLPLCFLLNLKVSHSLADNNVEQLFLKLFYLQNHQNNLNHYQYQRIYTTSTYLVDVLESKDKVIFPYYCSLFIAFL
jgi:hypothetical protein